MVERTWGITRPATAAFCAIAAVGLSIVAGFRLVAILPTAYVALVFLVAVLAVAAFAGLWAGVATAIGAFFAFNFFFVEPTFTFDVADPREVFALGIFLAAAILTGGLAGRLREVAEAARRRAETLAMLHGFAEQVSGSTDAEEIRTLVVRRVGERIHGTAILVDTRGALPGEFVAWPEKPDLSAEERHAIARVAATGRIAVAMAPDFIEHRFEFRPLVTAHGVVAVIGLAPASGARVVAGEDEQGLSALLDQAATALERAHFAEETVVAEAAVEQERLRSALLSSISHDLRTPLATILGSVTSLRQLGDRMEPAERDDLLAAIEEETDRLSRFVSDLLAMTRLEAGLNVRRDWVDVGDVAREAITHARRVHAGHRFEIRADTALPPVRSDSLLLEQVLFNLLDNAAKASTPGDPIALTVAAEAGAIVADVADRGGGLTPEQIARLFDGERAGAARPAPESRGGLGIAIARRVVAAMGGTIAAESPVVDGRGTRIRLCLPVEATPAAPDEGPSPT